MATNKTEFPFGYSYDKMLAYNELIEDNWKGVEFLRTKQYLEAERFYREMLGRFFQYQTLTDDRYHKGTPFHNLALSLVGQKGKLRDGSKYFILAYIEDVLSFGDGIAELQPAEQALDKMGMSGLYLHEVRAAALAQRTENPLTPEKIYAKFSASFEEPGLHSLAHEDILQLISVETVQGLSAIARYVTEHMDAQVNDILGRTVKDRIVAWIGLVIGALSLIITILAIFFNPFK